MLTEVLVTAISKPLQPKEEYSEKPPDVRSSRDRLDTPDAGGRSESAAAR
jgi:hypothetical protein